MPGRNPYSEDATGFRRSLWMAAPAVAALLVYGATLGAGYLYDDHADPDERLGP